jgi:hypothetical protein
LPEAASRKDKAASRKENILINAMDPIDEVSEVHELDLQAEDRASEKHDLDLRGADYASDCDQPWKYSDLSIFASEPNRDTDMNGSFRCDDWPSLEDACENWQMCDVSSVASSWLEIPCNNDESDEDLEGVIVLPSVVSTKTDGEEKCTSWSARVASTLVIGDAPKIPAAGALMPPLFQKRVVQKRHKHSETSEECNWELEDLELRRLRPQRSRGTTQLHRARKR